MEADIERYMDLTAEANSEGDVRSGSENGSEHDASSGEWDEEEEDDFDGDDAHFPRVPVVLPRARYAGAGNIETVKDGEPP